MARSDTLDRRGVAWGLVAVAVAVVLVIAGSGGLRWFDAALVGYLFGTLFAIFGVTYRYAVWLRRPPTALLRKRGWQALRRRDLRAGNARMIPGLVGANLLAQTFIRRRSSARWIVGLSRGGSSRSQSQSCL